MHQSVELELEEVDRFHDEQLLRKANVSPFFTSARPPFGMLHELDFTPQAIPRAAEEITASALSQDTLSLMPLLNLDGPDPCSDSASSLSWSSAGEFDSTLLSQVSSWQQDLDSDLHDESTGMLHADASYVDDYHQRFHCETNDNSSLFGQHLTSDQVYQSDGADGFSADRSNAYANDRQRVLAQRGSFKIESKDKRRDDRCTVRRAYHPDDLTMVESDDYYQRTTSTAECDARLYSLHGSPDSSSARSYLRVRESCARHARSSAHPYTRPLVTQRVMREKLFPLQHTLQLSKTRSFRVQPSATAAPTSSHSNSKTFQMIPFPMETLSIPSTESRCAITRTRQDSQHQQYHQTFKKQSPLPDAHRTGKMKRASQSVNLLALASPLTALSKKHTRDLATVLRMSAAPTTASTPLNRLYGALQPLHQHRSFSVDDATPRHAEMWYRSDEHSQYYHRARCAASSSSSFVPAVLVPSPMTSPPLLPTRKIGSYSPTARRARIERYHEKRKQLVFHKRIKYACRKRLAIACPRIKGRFVRKQALQEETPAAAPETTL